MKCLHKRAKNLNRRGKIINSLNEVLDEKKELVAALMVKCDKTEEQVMKASDEFYVKHKDGFISKEDYTNSTQVNLD